MDKEYIEDGYIKLSRRVFNSRTFSTLNAIQKLITIYLILMTNHQDNEWWDSYQKKFITIRRGSFITSVNQIRKKIKDKLVTIKKIRTTLKKLEDMQFLKIETGYKDIKKTDREVRLNSFSKKSENRQGKGQGQYTYITILKYNLYQDGENYKGKQKGKVGATNKNGKNGKNGNNVKKKYMEVVFLTKNEYKKLVDKFGEDITKDKIEELNNYIESKGKEKEYKSHYHTILCWDRKNKKGDQNGKSKGYNQRHTSRAGGEGKNKYSHLEEEYKV